jgi:phospholipase/carboxylesterase
MPIDRGADGGPASLVVVLLHGYMGIADDLAPFAKSLAVKARFVFPEGPIDLAPRGLRGRAWWPIDFAEKGPAVDLSDVVPAGLVEARACLDAILEDVVITSPPGCSIVLGGFSQGAMLACDAVLRLSRPFRGLAMFSGARIAVDQWRPRYAKRAGLRAFISHGRADAELSFSSAESFQAELGEAGWAVTWIPFAGGHEVPLVVWRAFKSWLTA